MNQSNKREIRTIMKKTPVLAFLALLLAATVCCAKVPLVDDADLVPAARHLKATNIIIQFINTYAYKKASLDDQLSAAILDKYLESLDPNRSYFTQVDIDEFARYRFNLDDALKEPDLAAAFEIFRRYRQRVSERSDFAIATLATEFDFNTPEDYEYDRREAPWAADQQALDFIWRQRVKNDILNLRIADKDAAEITDTLSKRYDRFRTTTHQLDANDVYQTFINAYTTAIEPHTSYFSPRTSENFDINMSLSLEGIGAELRPDNDYTTVERIITGGPADLSGALKAEDRIIGVGQNAEGEMVDVIGWRLDDVVDLIRGPKGTVVRLDVLPEGVGPEGPTKVIAITRDRIKLEDQAAKSSVIETAGGRIGVIDVPTFYSDFAAQSRGEKEFKSTTRDVRNLLGDLQTQKVEGIIIDIRGNGGGSLLEALELTGLFIESGPVVQTKDSYGRIDVNEDPDPEISYSGPLAVLVDRNSASASEIFAGAIQDYRRGLIIGEPTYGKGTVQNIVDLNRFVRNNSEDHGKLKTTIAQFFRVSGGSNQLKGVIPDIIFPTAQFTDEYGERSIDNALPWDQVEPARFRAVNAPVDSYAGLQQRHEQRIKDDKLFRLTMEQIALSYENSQRKSVSLLESDRKAEREGLETANRVIKNEIRMNHGLEPLPEDAELDDEALAETDTDAAADDTDETDDFDDPDVFLKEAANILTDLILPTRTTAAAQ
jgi:carboxyl-terminal processing protease